MFNFLDVVKWKDPQNAAEKDDVMVVEDTEGVYVQVRHITEDGFSDTAWENADAMKKVGRCTAYERAEVIYNRYKND